MIHIIPKGNIWDTPCEAIVIPVNCVGVMGAGLAKQCKERFPYIYKHYTKLCRRGAFRPGILRSYENTECKKGEFKYIYLLATKDHWRKPSQLEWIERGMGTLGTYLRSANFPSIAIPALGCGCGGLNWEDVLPIIQKELEMFKDYNRIELYEP